MFHSLTKGRPSLLKRSEFFAICHGSYQSLNFYKLCLLGILFSYYGLHCARMLLNNDDSQRLPELVKKKLTNTLTHTLQVY